MTALEARGQDSRLQDSRLGRWADVRTTILLTFLALCLYRATSQSVLHHLDSGFVIHQVNGNDTQHPWHMFALHPYVWLRSCLRLLGVSTLDSIRWTVALGGAVMVACAHRVAVTIGLPRREALGLVAIVICTPCVAYFSTIVELQGVVLGCTGIAMWTFTSLGRRPTYGRAVLLGLVTSLAAGVHSCQQLLPCLWPLLAVAGMWPKLPWRRGVLLLAVAAVIHATLYAALMLWSGQHQDTTNKSVVMLLGNTDGQKIMTSLGHRLLWEFLVPYLPGSLLLLGPARRVPWRNRLALLVATGIGCAATVLLLEGVETEERGAYMFFLVIPLALLAVTALPPSFLPLAVAAGVAGTCWLRWDEAMTRPCDPAVAAGALELEKQAPRLFLSGDNRVLDSLAMYAPDLRVVQVTNLHFGGRDAETVLANAFDELAKAVLPQVVTIDETTWASWRDGPWPEVQYLVRKHIPQSYQVTGAVSGGFRGMAVGKR